MANIVNTVLKIPSFLVCYAMKTGKEVPLFWKSTVPPSLRQTVQEECRAASQEAHNIRFEVLIVVSRTLHGMPDPLKCQEHTTQ